MRRSEARPFFALLLVLSVALGAAIAACSAGGSNRTDPLDDDTGVVDPDSIATDTTDPFDIAPPGDVAMALSIAPLDSVIDVTVGGAIPTVTYTATADGKTVAPAWKVDRGEIGIIDAAGVFTPGGKIGGKATITATYGGKTASTSVTVKLHMTQNGDPDAGKPVTGAGGNGGVGGEGPGAAVSAATKAVLDGAATADAKVKFLYPYDKTVWPRGILAPLMQWERNGHSFDGVLVQIKETSFDFKGYFAKTATPFLHHPVPQAVWKALAYSNEGEDVTVSLTFSEGTKAIGPITQTWKIARGPLKGTVYYNSYGTTLAKNYCCTPTGARFGAATLAIKGGSSNPVLIAGTDTDCRVCHSVASSGSMLVTARGDSYSSSSAYSLKAPITETPMSPGDGRFAWPAMFPDGKMLFGDSSPNLGSSSAPSGLFSVPSGAPITSSGLPSGLRAASPAFSPDGKHVSFNYYSGDQKSLAMMDFNPTTKAFSGLKTLYTPTAGTVVWSAWMPTSDSIVFELEVEYNGRDFGGTRASCDGCGYTSGARGELWWIDVKTKSAKRLDKLNGLGYLPKSADPMHDNDATYTYEPTISPVASGGYAWVVFTSRRLYGNVATINPYWSDPRDHDLSSMVTTKKLWVAAIDLSAAPGTDPSHPAFYIPGQELLAGNARGYWVVDPCKVDTSKCETGDECCGGFCQPDGAGGFTCGSKPPPCATEFEKCTTDADCCGSKAGLKCIGGRCGLPGPA